MLLLPEPLSQVRYKPWPKAVGGRIYGSVVSNPDRVELIDKLPQVTAMAALGNYSRILGRIEKFDQDQVSILLIGGQRLRDNLCIVGVMLHFRTYHTVTYVIKSPSPL